MDNPPVDFFGRESNLTRWLRLLKTRTKATEPFTRKQLTGLLLIGIGAVSVVVVAVIWGFVALVSPKIRPSAESLARSEEAAQLATTALRDFLQGNDVRIERLFAYNLKLYVDRKPFENIPYADRKALMAKIGRLWCDNIGYHLLARVGVFDIHSGEKLSAQACVFGF